MYNSCAPFKNFCVLFPNLFQTFCKKPVLVVSEINISTSLALALELTIPSSNKNRYKLCPPSSTNSFPPTNLVGSVVFAPYILGLVADIFKPGLFLVKICACVVLHAVLTALANSFGGMAMFPK